MRESQAAAIAPSSQIASLEFKTRSGGLARDTFRKLTRNPGAVAGLIVLCVIVLATIFAPAIAPYDPIEQDTQSIRQAPSREHLNGTDTFGRDVFSRVLY